MKGGELQEGTKKDLVIDKKRKHYKRAVKKNKKTNKGSTTVEKKRKHLYSQQLF